MKKIILAVLLLLIPSLTFAGSQQIRTVIGMCKAATEGSCEETPTYTIPYSSATPTNNTSYYYGMGYYDSTATKSLCRIDLWVQSITGNPGDITLTVYNVNQSTYAISGGAIATSNTVTQGNISAGSYVTFTFSTPVELTQSTAYGIQHRFSNGPSTTDYYTFGYQSDNPTDNFGVDGWAIKWLTGGGLSGSWDTGSNKSAKWYYYE